MTSNTPTVGQIEQRLNTALRIDLAEHWDNVGLLIGDRSHRVKRIMLCIDLTEPVLREASARRIDFILAYHPPIFDPLKSVVADRQNVVTRSVQSRLAVYAIHTALDMIPGGTSDALADLIDLRDRRPIKPSSRSDQVKVVVFVPNEHVDRVASAVFDAGGGVIGEYTRCSFRSAGTGTFLGGETSHPTVGRAGQFETVPEIRLEVLVNAKRLPDVLGNIRAAHPYEEPAVDVYPLVKQDTDTGLGRTGRLAKPASLKTVVTRIKRRTGLKHVLITPTTRRSPIRSAAVCPGSCGNLAHEIAGKVDLYLTGELRHHDAILLQSRDTALICLGHGHSERPALPTLAERVRNEFPQLTVDISTRDADPLQIV